MVLSRICGEVELVRQVHTLVVRSAQVKVVFELQVREEVEGVRQEMREVEDKESTMILANSTTKKSFVPIFDFCESPWAFARLLLLFKVDNAFLKSDLCVVRTVLEPCLFE